MLPSTGYLSLSLVSRSQTCTHDAHVRLGADAEPGSFAACSAQSDRSGVMLAAEFRAIAACLLSARWLALWDRCQELWEYTDCCPQSQHTHKDRDLQGRRDLY